MEQYKKKISSDPTLYLTWGEYGEFDPVTKKLYINWNSDLYHTTTDIVTDLENTYIIADKTIRNYKIVYTLKRLPKTKYMPLEAKIFFTKYLYETGFVISFSTLIAICKWVLDLF